ncbi:ferrous iron transport protein B [Treponema primitia ZAS-2]|uniref:Ferrous iron transport protein B n=1 Tax=Treponema primitia (strain ATCC BAA-887 / DSM 12427 / ZAS-2) TaxID=545694 RepID=F5YKL7_TREPZ|nr:ferrous iron transport protein B [Treponema primitia]AEF85391.1 ferrous iron transport protein B [Treponema primitia ZAS-2]
MPGNKNTLRIALAGNPNAGKTTLFNALTGAHHKVGNYPGVTVEKREGIRIRREKQYHFIDLPGIYSLTAYSIDEVVARDFILDEKPDVIVDVLDSTNLERNLYLCLQFQELGIPVIGALNMSDEAESKGIFIDDKQLTLTLGIPLVKTVGPKGTGAEALLDCIDQVMAVEEGSPAKADTGSAKSQNAGTSPSEAGLALPDKRLSYGAEIESRLETIQEAIASDTSFAAKYPVRWLAVKLIEKDTNAYRRLQEHPQAASIETAAREAVVWIEKHFGKDAEIIISEQRYGYIRGAVKESVQIVRKPDFSVTEALDRVIMNRFLSLPIFILVLWAVFQLTFLLGEYPMAWLEALFSLLSGAIMNAMPAGLLRSLLVDGIIGGVGGVLSFVPLIVILFFLLSILEDVGYMSRAAFATDKLLHSFGLHGQSVFPMMLGFGCSVPAIMASRTLKSPRDRILTILITPMMSCGAKLPVHVLLAAAFFPNHAANVIMLIYALGVILSLCCAFVLKKTVLKGDPTPFVMELPPYRSPTLRGILWHVQEKTWLYVKKAGTIILASAILIWAITSFPAYEPPPGLAEDSVQATEAALEHSYAGRLGKFIVPIFRPMGFEWKLAAASVTGFAAKEVIVSTLGILYRVGAEETEESEGLRDAIRQDPDMSPLAAFVFMLFTLIIPPCFAALATIKAEIGWKWLGFELVFLLALGWVLCTIVFQVGSLIGLGGLL